MLKSVLEKGENFNKYTKNEDKTFIFYHSFSPLLIQNEYVAKIWEHNELFNIMI